jgi:zinc transporter
LPDLHQKFMQEGDYLVRVHFAISSKLMITARRKPLRAIEPTRRAIEGAGQTALRQAAGFDCWPTPAR